MLEHTQEPITTEELERLKKGWLGWFSKGRFYAVGSKYEAQPSVDVYHATVKECFVPHELNEELPLYLLDVQGAIIILFGQWIFDPHTLIAPNDVFTKWDFDSSFFEKFTLRGLVENGIIFKFTIEGTGFVKAHKLPPGVKFTKLREFQIVKRDAATLVADLENAGLIEPVAKSI